MTYNCKIQFLALLGIQKNEARPLCGPVTIRPKDEKEEGACNPLRNSKQNIAIYTLLYMYAEKLGTFIFHE